MENKITTVGFHNFHRNLTPSYLHDSGGPGDEMIGYRYIEKSTEKFGVVVFVPSHIHHPSYKILNSILEDEFAHQLHKTHSSLGN